MPPHLIRWFWFCCPPFLLPFIFPKANLVLDNGQYRSWLRFRDSYRETPRCLLPLGIARGTDDLQSSVPPSGESAVIPRYTRPEMARIWSDENRFRTWLAVEVAATETLAAAGIVQIEAEVKHDVIAFTTAVAEIVGPHARWFHYGLTSNDVVDTAQALLIQQASS